MISWQDEGIITSFRRHGESAAILEILTREHGRHMGIVRGGASRRHAPRLQPAQHVRVDWRARLDEHMGSFTIEGQQSFIAKLMADPLAMSGFQSLSALLHVSLAERDPHNILFDALLSWLSDPRIDEYIQFELLLLREGGFRLALDKCALTGVRDGLAFISPRTGRAVTREAAGKWAQQLLLFDPLLIGENGDPLEALRVTGYFLENWLMPAVNRHALPDARTRYVSAVRRSFNSKADGQ